MLCIKKKKNPSKLHFFPSMFSISIMSNHPFSFYGLVGFVLWRSSYHDSGACKAKKKHQSFSHLENRRTANLQARECTINQRDHAMTSICRLSLNTCSCTRLGKYVTWLRLQATTFQRVPRDTRFLKRSRGCKLSKRHTSNDLCQVQPHLQRVCAQLPNYTTLLRVHLAIINQLVILNL